MTQVLWSLVISSYKLLRTSDHQPADRQLSQLEYVHGKHNVVGSASTKVNFKCKTKKS